MLPATTIWPSQPFETARTPRPRKHSRRYRLVKYDAGSEHVVMDLAASLSELKINALDVVVANAGILKQWGLARAVKKDELVEHFSINTVGPILLYQATLPLLEKSAQTPKFFIISSSLGSNTLMDTYLPLQLIAYNVSKSAVNSAAGRIHREEDRIVVVPVQPGWIATDMGSRAAGWAGMNTSDPPVKIDDAISGLMQLFDKATKAEHSGKFFDQK